MSLALYERSGLRFWTEDEIATRNYSIATLLRMLRRSFEQMNSAWTFHQIEGPALTPRLFVSSTYDADDIFIVNDGRLALRPETTASSYLMAAYFLSRGIAKAPLCVWQAGKSFRVESNDGASAPKLRFNEFWQCEFQFIFGVDTKAPVYDAAVKAAADAITRITGADHRIVVSDRLPAYATETTDIEVQYGGKWKEMASISRRTDYPDKTKTVVEVAVGLDRLISVEAERQT